MNTSIINIKYTFLPTEVEVKKSADFEKILKIYSGVPVMVQQQQTQLVSMSTWAQFLA